MIAWPTAKLNSTEPQSPIKYGEMADGPAGSAACCAILSAVSALRKKHRSESSNAQTALSAPASLPNLGPGFPASGVTGSPSTSAGMRADTSCRTREGVTGRFVCCLCIVRAPERTAREQERMMPADCRYDTNDG